MKQVRDRLSQDCSSSAFESMAAPASPPLADQGPVTVQRSVTGQTEVKVEIDREQVRSLARRFGLPANQLRQVLHALEDKTSRTAEMPNLTVQLKP